MDSCMDSTVREAVTGKTTSGQATSCLYDSSDALDDIIRYLLLCSKSSVLVSNEKTTWTLAWTAPYGKR